MYTEGMNSSNREEGGWEKGFGERHEQAAGNGTTRPLGDPRP
jgi:hypothetical protein